MKSDERNKPAGIKEIADALHISIGTVDRALHDRPGVSARTRDRVLKMAQKLKYKPNIAARSLRLNRHLRIGVFLPREISFFFDTLRDGIRVEAERAGASVDLEFYEYPLLGVGDVEAMKKADWQSFDGIILAPAEPERLMEITRAASQAAKPIVFVATDAPRLPRQASISTDAYVSGGIAADLLGRFINEESSVALFTGSLRVEDHAEKLRGFAASLATLSSHLTLLPVVETHESPQEAYKEAMALLKSQRRLRGIYVNTANSIPVMRAIRESQRLGKISVVTTDLFPELAALIESGHVAASLYQRPFTQGRLAFEALYQCLNNSSQPKLVTRLAPHIVLRSNLVLFADTLERDEVSPSA